MKTRTLGAPRLFCGNPRLFCGNPRLFCVVALAVCFSAAISRAQQNQDPVVGTWISTGTPSPVTLVLNADGTGSMNTTQIRWNDTNGFNIIVGSNTVSYNLSLNNDTMIISGGDLQQPMTFARQGAQQQQPAQQPTALGSVLGGAGSSPSNNSGGDTGGQGDPTHPAAMFGAWVLQTSDGNLFLVLNADGSGQLGNSPFRWAVQNGTISLEFSNGKGSQFPVTVYGDTMTMSATSDQGQPMQLVFHRTQMPSGGPDTQNPQPQPQPQQPQPNQQQPANPTGYDDTAAFVGQWTSANGQVTIIFYPNGTTHFGSDQLFNYTAVNGTLTIVNPADQNDRTAISYRLDGNTLYMVINNQNVTFNRSGAAPQPAPQPGAGQPAVNPLGSEAPGMQPAPQPAPAAPAIDPAVVGAWKGSDGTVITLNADGTFVWNGQQMRYTAANGVMTIQTANGQMQWQYQANGNQIQVTFNGNSDTLQRVNAAQ